MLRSTSIKDNAKCQFGVLVSGLDSSHMMDYSVPL